MKNHKEKIKIVVAFAVVVMVLCAGIYFLRIGNIHGFLEQGGTVAVRAFKDVLAPSTSDAVVSEIDLSSSTLHAEGADAVSSTPSGVAFAKKDGCPTSTVADGGVALVSSTSFQSLSAVQFEPSSTAENSSTDISVPDMDCSFPATAPTIISHRVILNEIAWMGMPSSTSVTSEQAANGEWIELKNISGGEISLNGWRILDPAGKIKISFGSGDTIAPNGLYLLSRGGTAVGGISADKAYTGILSNSGGELAVLDAACNVSDLLAASSKWPGGSNVTKQTLERKTDLTWQTSAVAGGTPRAENSAGVIAASATVSSTEKYEVNVMISGDDSGQVIMKPGGTTCKESCTNEYAYGTTVTLTATPGNGAHFGGWSGGCAGTAGCSFMVGGPVLVNAAFESDIHGPPPADSGTDISEDVDISPPDSTSTADDDPSEASSTDEEASSSSSSAIGHLVIAAVQIAGAATDDDFVKIYDPTPSPVDVSGWKLRKKSSTGTDASLREFPKGSTVASGGYFTWASSADGFAGSIGADTSSTGTLAADNSVALFDATGAQIDAVAWGTGTDQYVEDAAYPDSPTANQILQRKFVDGSMVDTDNNSNDFEL